jgi:hypothetical protein
LRNRLVALFAGIALLTPPASVSAGPKFTPYPERKVSDCAVKADKGDISVGAQAVEDTKDQKAYFATEMTEKGYLPVYVVIENRSDADSYLFDKSNVAMAGASSGAVNEARSKTGEKFAMFGVGGIFAMRAITSATAVQENLLNNEIQSKTLSPGVSVKGFLYIPIPKEGVRGGIHVQIPLVNSRTSEIQIVNLTI